MRWASWAASLHHFQQLSCQATIARSAIVACIIKQNMKSIYDCFGYCLVKTRDRRRIDCIVFEIRWCRYSSCRRRDSGCWCTWVYITTDCESSLYKAAAARRWTKTGKHCLPQHTLPQSSDNCHWTLSGESCECICLDSNEQYLVLWCCRGLSVTMA